LRARRRIQQRIFSSNSSRTRKRQVSTSGNPHNPTEMGMSVTYHFIQAATGYHELTAFTSKFHSGLIFYRRPIVAWKIADHVSEGHSATPVAVDSGDDPQEATYWAVLSPTGEVNEVYEGGQWQSETEWREEVSNQFAAHQAA